VTDVRTSGYRGTVRTGSRAPVAPSSTAWSASAAGTGTQTARWNPETGRWAIVVMNANGGPGVSVDVQVGARAGWLLPLSIGLLLTGGLLAAAAAALIGFGAAGATPTSELSRSTPAVRAPRCAPPAP
jgi:hypothetical protein